MTVRKSLHGQINKTTHPGWLGGNCPLTGIGGVRPEWPLHRGVATNLKGLFSAFADVRV